MTRNALRSLVLVTLAFCAQEIDLGGFLLLGKGEDATGLDGARFGGVGCDGGALIGAIYLDGGFANAKSLSSIYSERYGTQKLFYDSKTILQGSCAGTYGRSYTFF